MLNSLKVNFFLHKHYSIKSTVKAKNNTFQSHHGIDNAQKS